MNVNFYIMLLKRKHAWYSLTCMTAWKFWRGWNLFPPFPFFFVIPWTAIIERGCLRWEAKEGNWQKGKERAKRLAGRQTWEGGSSPTCVWFTAVSYNLLDQREIQLSFFFRSIHRIRGLFFICDCRCETTEIIAFWDPIWDQWSEKSVFENDFIYD